ncbi:MAG TPA: GNAT family N-acetyltransferase [Pseudorhodoplanes sp.]|nr:GNAT family N-acetyltransferase [Pseudorhodoplanes sp.]
MDDATHITAPGSVAVVSRSDLAHHERWRAAFAHTRKDHRYYEIVEDTLHPEFVHRYLVVSDRTGTACAVQPFFVLDLDLAEGLSRRVKAAIRLIRRLAPRFMRMRALMLGCVAGEGHLDGTDEASRDAIAPLLARPLIDEARRWNAGLVIFKEFPARYRKPLEHLRQHGYFRIPSLPAVRLNIGYAGFDDYMCRALSGNARNHLRRNLKASACAAIDLQVICDIAPFIDEAYPLYLQVYERSDLHFEQLTRDYFCALGSRMPDKVRFFLWRRGSRLVAFSTCMLEGDVFCAEYIGLDYTAALDLHLYYRVFHDELNWAMANGCRWYRSGQVKYDPKLHLGFALEPLDLYIRHTSDVFNAPLGFLLPLLEPTRSDPTLRKFSNYAALWGDAAPAP